MSHPLTRRALVGSAALAALPASLSAMAQTGPEPLRIGFQKGSINLALLKLRGGLDRHLPGTPVSWIEFPAGPQLLEALALGSIDLGGVGDSPPVFAQAAGKALVYVGAEPAKPDSSALLVKPDAPLKTLADLKGKRVAVQKGSSAHFLLVQSLKKAGLAWADISAVYLAPADARAAFERGSVDLGGVGDSPPVFAQAAGKALVYVGAEPAKPDSSALLVKPDAPLKTLADLKGRRVAVQKGSSAHFLLVQSLKKAGLAWADITAVYLAPADARAAFERGSVDAWVIWDPYYAAAEVAGGVRVLATSRGLTNNNTFYLAAPALTQREPLLRAFFAALNETDAYAREQRTDAARRYADFAGLGLATVLRVLERRPSTPIGPLTPALVAEQQQVADAFAQLGLIPKPIRVADIVWRPAAAKAA